MSILFSHFERRNCRILSYPLRFEVFLYGEISNAYGCCLCLTIHIDFYESWADILKGIGILKIARCVESGAVANLDR